MINFTAALLAIVPYILMPMTQFKQADDFSNSVVQLNSGFLGRGTAFSIGPRRYATVAHCVLGSVNFGPFGKVPFFTPEVELVFKNGDTRVARVTYVDKDNDIALLTIKEPVEGVKPLKWALREPKYGDKLVTIGNVFALGWVREEGTVASLQSKDIMALLNGNPGFSGSPVVNAEGYVVGILSYGIGLGGTMTYTGIRKAKWAVNR